MKQNVQTHSNEYEKNKWLFTNRVQQSLQVPGTINIYILSL